MKRILICAVLCYLVRFGSAAQYPQYEFYAQPDFYGPYDLLGIERPTFDDDFSRYLYLSSLKASLLLWGQGNTPEYVRLEYELYQIESRILVRYTTSDNLPHPYFDSLLESEMLGAHMPDINSEKMAAYFLKAPERLDASVFTENLTRLELPRKADIIYTGSPLMNVANLKSIWGKDVHPGREGTFLVDKNGILVAGAIYGITDVLIPSYAVALGDGCFRGAGALTSVHCRADVVRIGERALDVPSPLSLYLECVTPVEIHPLAFGDNAPHKIFVPDKKLAKTYSKLYPQWKKLFKVDKTLAR